LIYAGLMGQALLTERHAKQIAGVLSCYDRVIVQGTLPVGLKLKELVIIPELAAVRAAIFGENFTI
jgi:hypothetical protein